MKGLVPPGYAPAESSAGISPPEFVGARSLVEFLCRQSTRQSFAAAVQTVLWRLSTLSDVSPPAQPQQPQQYQLMMLGVCARGYVRSPCWLSVLQFEDYFEPGFRRFGGDANDADGRSLKATFFHYALQVAKLVCYLVADLVADLLAN